MIKRVTGLQASCQTTIWLPLRNEWHVWLGGALFSYIFAMLLISGWPIRFFPDLSYPYIYSSDGLSHSWLIQRTLEGWIFENSRSGYPFGSNFLDYPGSDTANLLVIKIIGYFAHTFYSTLDVYFILSFPVTFVVSYCVIRAFGLGKIATICAALLFDFQSFHFQRLVHLFYTWYFVVPIYFYVACRVDFPSSSVGKIRSAIGDFLLRAFFFLVMASFGVYFSVFGVIIILMAALFYAIKNSNIYSLKKAIVAIAFIIAGVGFNLGPSVLHIHVHGANSEVAARNPAESENYGFKLMQLILPRDDYRIKSVSTEKAYYNNSSPLVNENKSASIGIVGTIGFVMIGVVAFLSMVGKQLDTRVSVVSLLTIVLFLFGTVGGLGSLFAYAISPEIRAWNRCSIFISFGSIFVFFLLLDLYILNRLPRKLSTTQRGLIFSALLITGLADQTSPACRSCNQSTKSAFLIDRTFVQKIESDLPPGSAVYQLPYMPFPETPPMNGLSGYGLLSGVLQSATLRWSFAGIKGRIGDLFYRSLSQQPIDKQVDVVSRLGFSGIYVDRSGYEDKGEQVINRLTKILGAPVAVRADGVVVFFQIRNAHRADLDGLNAKQIMRIAGFFVDEPQGP